MECLVCKRTGEKTFNINLLCGNAKNTIRDDIIEFLGSGIEPHLKAEDVVCNTCMTMLDDIAKIKPRLLDSILTRRGTYPIKLGKCWEFYAKTSRMQFEENEFDELITPSSLTPLSSVPNARTPTPSQFWSFSHSKEYNPELEQRFARREKVKQERSASKASIRSNSSLGNDEEVATLFKGKKRKGRRPRSAGGLPKVITKKLRRAQSENDRSHSSLSDRSLMSCTRFKKDFRPRTPKLVYDEDNELIRPKTRSISRMLFYCTECCEDEKYLELYTAHMISEHNRNACYRCWECGCSFLSEDHLKMHEKMHSSTTICPICSRQYDNLADLQKHISRHFQYSVPCSFCDLSFLSVYECNSHVFNHHRRKRRKLRNRKQNKIEQIETYVETQNNDKRPWDSNYDSKTYEAREMVLKIDEKLVPRKNTFEEIDYRLRRLGPEIVSKEKTSLGDDLVVHQENRYTPVSMFSETDANLSDSSIPESISPRKRKPSFHSRSPSTFSEMDIVLSDSSISETVDQRKRKKIFYRSNPKRSYSRNRHLSPVSHEPPVTSSPVNDRLSPPEKSVPGLQSSQRSRSGFDDDSDDSEQSDSIQTEMHYFDGQKLIPDIDSVNVSSASSETSAHGVGLALEPDIENE